MPRSRTPRLPQQIRITLAMGSLLLLVGVFLFTNSLIHELNQQTDDLSKWVAQFCADASFPATSDSTIQPIFQRLVDKIKFPLVITDSDGNPRAWKGVGMAPDRKSVV